MIPPRRMFWNSLELGLLDLAVRRQHDDELVLGEVLDRDDRGDLLVGLELEQVDDGLAPAGRTPTSGISRALSQ